MGETDGPTDGRTDGRTLGRLIDSAPHAGRSVNKCLLNEQQMFAILTANLFSLVYILKPPAEYD